MINSSADYSIVLLFLVRIEGNEQQIPSLLQIWTNEYFNRALEDSGLHWNQDFLWKTASFV